MTFAVLVDGMSRFGHIVRHQTGVGRRDITAAAAAAIRDDGISDVDVNHLRFEEQLEEEAPRETRQQFAAGGRSRRVAGRRRMLQHVEQDAGESARVVGVRPAKLAEEGDGRVLQPSGGRRWPVVAQDRQQFAQELSGQVGRQHVACVRAAPFFADQRQEVQRHCYRLQTVGIENFIVAAVVCRLLVRRF